MKTQKFLLWGFVALLMVFVGKAEAKPDEGSTTKAVYNESGKTRGFYRILVGSNTPTAQPYDSSKVRSATIQNTGPSVVVISSWGWNGDLTSTFSTTSDSWAPIAVSSATGFNLQSNSTFYLTTLSGNTSSWVTISIEGEANR